MTELSLFHHFLLQLSSKESGVSGTCFLFTNILTSWENDPLQTFRHFVPQGDFVMQLFSWAQSHPGDHALNKVFSTMRKQRPLSRYERALITQVCACFERRWLSMEDEHEQVTIAQRAQLALAHLKDINTDREQVRSAILLIMGMLME